MIRAIVEHWPIFLAGFAFAFLASFAAAMAWWVLILTKHHPNRTATINHDFQTARDAIRRANMTLH